MAAVQRQPAPVVADVIAGIISSAVAAAVLCSVVGDAVPVTVACPGAATTPENDLAREVPML